MNERHHEEIAEFPAAQPGTQQLSEPAPPEIVRARPRRPLRWLLGAVSIAAVGAGVIFISKRGFRKE